MGCGISDVGCGEVVLSPAHPVPHSPASPDLPLPDIAFRYKTRIEAKTAPIALPTPLDLSEVGSCSGFETRCMPLADHAGPDESVRRGSRPCVGPWRREQMTKPGAFVGKSTFCSRAASLGGGRPPHATRLRSAKCEASSRAPPWGGCRSARAGVAASHRRRSALLSFLREGEKRSQEMGVRKQSTGVRMKGR